MLKSSRNNAVLYATIVVAVLVVGTIAIWTYFYSPEARVAHFTGKEAASIIFGSDDWDLVTLYPFSHLPREKLGTQPKSLGSRPNFGPWPELDRAKLTPGEVRQLREVLADAIINVREDEVYGCYWPRHGLCIRHAGKEQQFYFSFQCRRASTSLNEPIYFSISTSALPTFNRMLEQYGLESDPGSPGIEATTVGMADLIRQHGHELMEVIANAESVELLSLEPDQIDLSSDGPSLGDTPSEVGTLGGYPIIGRVLLSNDEADEVRAATVDAIVEGLRDGASFHCFVPRHGLILRFQGQEYRFVVCFECRQVDVLSPHNTGFLISSSPTALFNRLLDAHNVVKSSR